MVMSHNGTYWTMERAWKTRLPGPRKVKAHMDQINIKTPNPKCRLYLCFIEFLDWRYSQSCWYFLPLLWTCAPLTFSLVPYPLPPFPVWISSGVQYTVCNRRGGDRVVWRAYAGVTDCVFDQIPNIHNCFTTPNINLGGKGTSDR